MARRDFTKEEADIVVECINDIFKNLSKAKQMNLLGALNEVMYFLDVARENAPSEQTPPEVDDRQKVG